MFFSLPDVASYGKAAGMPIVTVPVKSDGFVLPLFEGVNQWLQNRESSKERSLESRLSSGYGREGQRSVADSTRAEAMRYHEKFACHVVCTKPQISYRCTEVAFAGSRTEYGSSPVSYRRVIV